MISKTIQRISDVIIPVCLVIMVLIMVWMWGEDCYWKYSNFKPIIIHDKEISVLNPGKTVCAGSMLIYGFEFTKTMNVKCTVKRQLFDGSLILFDPLEPPRKPVGRQKVVADLFVPTYASPREWAMRWTTECEVGPNKRIVAVTAVSEKFRVVDCSAKGKQGPQGKQGKTGPAGPAGKNFWGK